MKVIYSHYIFIKKEKFRKRNNWKLLFLLPVTFILVFIFACSSQEDLKSSEALKNELIENNDVFDNVDVMPLFNNGDPSVEFRKYIYQNLKYPEIASKKGITGRVIVQFTVNKEGKIVNPSIRSNSDPELNEEVLRLLTSSPNWIPGKQKGNPANVRFTFPVNFILK